ncbi:MAG: TonB-dependent receptor [Rikenellaceae bacterium]
MIALLFAPLQSTIAQGKTPVSGVVTDADTGEPLIGATVILVGKSGVGTITDADGHYTLKVAMGDKLEFSFLSMKSRTVVVKSSELNIQLISDNVMIEQVVAIGYGSVRKKELTGATAHISSERIEEFVATDLGQTLQGLVPGLSVSSSGGDPGDPANIQIRGISSLSAGNDPLYVIDGIPQDGVPELNSNEIATIDILKDAASSAIYGTRGAAGVILITTKQGEVGKLKVSFSSSIGFPIANYDNLPELMNANEQTYYKLLVSRRSGTDLNDFTYDQNKDQYMFQNDNDAVSTVLASGTPVKQNYSVSMSGGVKQLTYSGSLSYSDIDGIVLNSGYKRFNLRANINYQGKKTKISQSFSYLMDDQDKAGGASFATAIKVKPYYPLVTRDMTEYVFPIDTESTSQSSSISSLLRNFTSVNNNQKIVFSYNLGIDHKITNNLTFTTKASIGTTTSYGFKKTPKVAVYNIYGVELGSSTASTTSKITNSTSRRVNFSSYGGLNYKKSIDKIHNFSANALVSYESAASKGFTASQQGLVGDLDVLNSGTMLPNVSSSDYTNNLIFGVIGRVQYDYRGRYLFSASLRADASSKFADDNRWGYFPSVSAGWNISDEKFWKPLKRVVTNAKLRASYGTTGNEKFDAYTYQDVVTLGYDYVLGGDTYYGYTAIEYPNYDVKWETSTQINLGLDLGLFSNKLQFNADVYRTEKKDMLATVRLPISVGAGDKTNMIQNVGNMVNTGIELNLTYRKVFTNKISLITSVNFYKNYNEITSLGTTDMMLNPASALTSDANSTVTAFATGYEAGAFFLYKHDGVIKTQEELDAYNKATNSEAELGDMRYKDVNGDNYITDDDRAYCGSGFSDFEMGLNLNFKWNNFDIAAQFFGSYGNLVLNGLKADSFDDERNAELVNMWSTQNPTSDIPVRRASSSTQMNYIGYSDLWLEDGSYIRLKLLSVGYTIIPKRHSFFSSARFYISGQNVLTLTGYSGLDPDVGGNGLTTRGVDKGAFPTPKEYIAGIKFNF